MAANLEFSMDEFKVMHDAQFFIHKKNISDKVIANFSLLNTKIEVLKSSMLSAKACSVFKQGKISRGENYELLPYFILDNPGVFNGKDVCAFRVMFWWGNFYSCTLHVSGIYLDLLAGKLESLTSNTGGYYFCTNKDQWQHHFREDNYQLIDENSFRMVEGYTKENVFIKIAFKKPLSDFENFEKEVLVFLSKVFYQLEFKNQ